MKTNELEKNLSQLGFPLLEVDPGQVNVNKTLADVVKSDNARFWEAFPVLLINAHKTGDFDVKKVEAFLPNSADRKKFRSLLNMSLALYPVMKKYFEFAKQMEKNFSSADSKWVKEFRNKARTRAND